MADNREVFSGSSREGVVNPELIKQWAVESGFARQTFKIDVEGRSNLRLKFDEAKLPEFAALVAAHQRELDAKVCEAEDVATTDFAPGVQECIAAAIRGTK